MHFPVVLFYPSCQENSVSTCDGNNVQQPPHGLWADVTKPVLSNQQLGEVKGHLPGDGPLHVPTPVCVLERKWKIMEILNAKSLNFYLFLCL